ncbi:MAG: DNA mismatch endonuclease Vsr [Proteobacteria bacterium]|nr:DNA mismatch endonuclease Vsr [Pseudomonadota bacterium]
MSDIVDKPTRSRMMAGIGGKNTRPEMALRRALHAKGLRYRLHSHRLPGKPDLLFPQFKAVVFVHGCFWHRHAGCRYATEPRTRASFWKAKFSANVARDRRVAKLLAESGWRVATVWECALRDADGVATTSGRVAAWLRSASETLDIGKPRGKSAPSVRTRPRRPGRPEG